MKAKLLMLIAGLALNVPSVYAAIYTSPPANGGKWGVYPNCIGPAVPVEEHSWWDEDAHPEVNDNAPRHLHTAACLPNARAKANSIVPNISQPEPFIARVMTYNTSSIVTYTRWAWESSVKQIATMNVSCTPSVASYVVVGGKAQCTWYVDMMLNPATAFTGIDEIRVTSSISRHTTLGTQQYTSLNYQLPVAGKTGTYRSTTDLHGRAWYPGTSYSNVIINYGELLANTPMTHTMPTVRGVVPIKWKTGELPASATLNIWQDMNHHQNPTFWKTATEGSLDPVSGGKLVRKITNVGNSNGVFNWNTVGLSNGVHKMYFQVQESDANGTNASALLFLFNVQQ